MLFLYYALSLAAVAAFASGAVLWLPAETLPEVWREGNFIENMTAYLFAAAMLAGFYNAKLSRMRGWLYGGLLMMFAVMREMDLHKEMTTDSVFKSRFYSGDAPLEEKLFGALVIFLLLYLVVFFIRKVPHWVRLLRAQDGASWGLFLTLGTAAVAKMLDSITRLIPAIEPFYEMHRPWFVITEETLELLSSIMFFLLFVYGVRAIKRGTLLFVAR